MTTFRSAPTGEVDPRTLYSILRLRSEVFVVEQACAYLDPDGRDVEPAAVQWWAVEGDGGDGVAVTATARVLRDPDGRTRIGRICTSAATRGTGLGAALLRNVMAASGPGEIVIDAQSRLCDWYAHFGFQATGHDFVEDGIAHSEMIRPAGAP